MRRAPGPDKRSSSRFLARVLPGAQPAAKPGFIEPCLPTLRKAAPAGAHWVHEIAFDGCRIQAHLEDRRSLLFTRNGDDWTARFSRIASALRALPVNQIILDGEVIVQDKRGHSDMRALTQDLEAGRQNRFVYYVFDLLHLDGFTITASPLEDRKRVLASLLKEAGPSPIVYSQHLEMPGPEMFEHAEQMGLEGIVSKLRDSAYQSGRTTSWVETKVTRTATLVGLRRKGTEPISQPVARRTGKASAKPPQEKGPLLVIDGDSFAHRAYHAVPKSIRRADGTGGNAIVGFANYLLRLYESERPRAVLVAWDTLSAPNWRSRLFKSYQSGRTFDKDLVEQLDVLPEFVAACGFLNAKQAGYEADDFLAAAKAREEKRGGAVVIASGDRDAFQLASPSTTILHPVRAGEMARIGVSEVRDRYGVDPEQVPDFIALRGDPSDKIPGAMGIGATGAASVLRRYRSLEDALAAGLFASQADALRLYRRITTMDAKAPLPRLVDARPDWQAASALADQWGLRALARRLQTMADGT